MPKKIKPQAVPPKPEPRPAAEPILSRRGKITIGTGVAVAALGYYILTLTDPAGQNWASNVCPFLILGGYTIIGIGIVLPDPQEPENPSRQ